MRACSLAKFCQARSTLCPYNPAVILALYGIHLMDKVADAGQAGFVANMSDIAPRYAGRLFGLANTFGSFAGILGVSAVGFVVEKTGSFDPVFKLTAVMYIAATVVWNLMCTGEKVFD